MHVPELVQMNFELNCLKHTTCFLLREDENSFSPLLTKDLAISRLPHDESKNSYRSLPPLQSNRKRPHHHRNNCDSKAPTLMKNNSKIP